MHGLFTQACHAIKYTRLFYVLGLQSISLDVADNASHPRRLDPTMELITYSFVLYLQHGRHDVKCKPSIQYTQSLSSECKGRFPLQPYRSET